MVIFKIHISKFSFLEHEGMLRSSSGLPLTVLLFIFCFRDWNPAKPG